MRKSTSNKPPKKRRSINRLWRKWRRLNKPPKKRISNFFAVLGGADIEILKHVDSERSTFVGIGAVMLGTASVAALSMVFALYNAVLVVSDPSTGQRAAQQPIANLVISIIFGLLWGAFILVVDRALIKTMQGVHGLGRAFRYATPRLLLALIIGLVVSTPFTLQIFRSEIAVEMKNIQVDNLSEYQKSVDKSDVMTALNDKRTKINEELAIYRGDKVEDPEDLALAQAQADYDEAQKSAEDAQSAAQTARQQRTCEINPNNPNCESFTTTGVPGTGAEAEALEKAVEAAQQKSKEADAKRDAAKTALDAAKANHEKMREESQKEQIDKAHITLCGESAPRDSDPSAYGPDCEGGYQGELHSLEENVNTMLSGREAIRNNNGLLVQITALWNTSFDNPMGFISHAAVALLFIIIELFPVGIKTMVAVRGESQYDRVFRKLQESELEKVEAHTAQERDRIDREARRIREIGEDMLQREIDLGKSANEHVAEQMQIILDQTLSHWTERSQTMLAPYLGGVGENAERPADPARPEQAAAPTRPEARPEQPADLGLLPDGSQLAALELGARIGSMGSPSASRDADHFSKRYRALLAIQDEAIRLQREADELAGVGLSAERARLEEMQHELMAAQTAEKEIVADIARHERALAVAERERAELEEQRERLVGQVSEVGAERSRTQDEVNELAERVQRKTDEISVLEAHHRELKGRLDEANRLFDRLSSLGSAPIPAEAADLLRSIRALAQDLPGEERAPGAGPRQ